MGKGPVVGMATLLGRQLGEWIADHWGQETRATLDEGKRLTGPLARALLDTFVVDRLVGAVWPSAVILAVILCLHATSTIVQSLEAERILTGLAVLMALIWSVYGIVEGARIAWPHLRLWMVTRLPPTAHVRMLLFCELCERCRSWQAGLSEQGFRAVATKEAFSILQVRLKLTPERVAFMIADHLAPILVRHLTARLAMVLLPVVGALLYYRFAIYPDVIQQGTGGGPWSIVLYPFAALADAVVGSSLRSALLSQP